MRVLFASDYAHWPENTGGLEMNTHEICLALQAAGHTVAILAALIGRGATGFIAKAKLRGGLASGWATDTGLGYPVMRSWIPADNLGLVMERFRPDVVVVQSWRFAMVKKVIRRGAGAVLYSHSAYSAIEGVDDRDCLDRCVLLANSAFNAGFQGRALGARFDVLFPLVNPSRYRCDVSGTHVVQIGLTTRKGARVTLEIARRRTDIPFIIVKNWEGLKPLPEDEGLEREASALPNLRVIKPFRDARKLYRISRLVLVPSVWPETWGRVVTEAQINGIPVVSSNRGGLPEAVGQGGQSLDPDSPGDVWVDAISRLWDDPLWHKTMSDRALLRSLEDDIATEPLFKRFVGLLDVAIGRRAASVTSGVAA